MFAAQICIIGTLLVSFDKLVYLRPFCGTYTCICTS